MVQADERAKLEMGGTDRLRAVLICGPTASGKSALALELAQQLGGGVVNADSMQVYAELRVITNRPSPQEEAAAPHRLYGTRPMHEPYSAALWLADVKAVLDEAEQRGWLPIIAGGTGLYFKALTEGLSEIPGIPAAIRTHYRLAAQTRPAAGLYAELQRRDPRMAARLRPADPQRIVRALEVIEATGRSLADWQEAKQPPLLPLSQACPVAVTIDRGELYRRCDTRLDAMLAHGAIDEARAVAALGLDPALPAMRAVGLPQLLGYVRGEMSLDEAAAAAKTATRRYAKRQLTWIRSNFSEWNAYNT
jgi:tRNA dimethylallyltransferase